MSTARIALQPAYVEGYDDVKPSKRPHYLTLVSSNGETLATSELYATRGNARRAAEDWLAAFRAVSEAVEFHDAPVYVEAKPPRMTAVKR